MPTISPVQSVDVQGAIARAATRTGVDFDYLLAQARLESGLDPSAKARTSSATGLYQFIDSTWLRTLDRHGAKHGMDWADAAIGSNGRVADRATRDHLLSLRYDADTSSLMAAELTRENAAGLQTILGREAEPAELYLAHFMTLGDAAIPRRAGQQPRPVCRGADAAGPARQPLDFLFGWFAALGGRSDVADARQGGEGLWRYPVPGAAPRIEHELPGSFRTSRAPSKRLTALLSLPRRCRPPRARAPRWRIRCALPSGTAGQRAGGRTPTSPRPMTGSGRSV